VRGNALYAHLAQLQFGRARTVVPLA
jgi:hypothetical protein